MQPLISVIIPTYNSVKYIRETVESALNQTYRNIEIIVVDDGSTDNTKEVLKHYLDRIQYIYKENAGPASARNVGIKHAKGEYIAFLDADDIWLAEKLEFQIKEIADGIGLVGSKCCENENQNINIKDISYKNLLIKNTFSNSSVLVRKECFDKVGFFDEKPEFKAVEDWDMWLRIARHYKVKYLDSRLVKIRQTQNSISSARNADKVFCNELCVLRKTFSDKSFKTNWFLKRRAYSYRYYSAAVAYRETHKTSEARKYILKAIFLYPFNFINTTRLAFIVNTILGLYR